MHSILILAHAPAADAGVRGKGSRGVFSAEGPLVLLTEDACTREVSTGVEGPPAFDARAMDAGLCLMEKNESRVAATLMGAGCSAKYAIIADRSLIPVFVFVPSPSTVNPFGLILFHFT